MLTTTNVKDTYAGNGVTTLFPITFQFQENAQLYVFSRNTTTLVDTELTVGADYTVNGGDPGNEVELDVALASGDDLYIYRVTERVQDKFDALNNSAFLAEDLENAVDRNVMILQELADRVPVETDFVSLQALSDAAEASATSASGSAAAASVSAAAASVSAAAAASVLVLDITAKTANYTLVTADELVTGDATGGAFTLTLPTAVGNSGKVFTLKKIDSSLVNQITVATTSSQTIDGVTTTRLATPYETIQVVSNGANWILLQRTYPSIITPGAFTYTGFGTPTQVENVCRRNGKFLVVTGYIIAGTVSATGASIVFPSGLTIEGAHKFSTQRTFVGQAYRSSSVASLPAISLGPWVIYANTGNVTDLFITNSSNVSASLFPSVSGNSLLSPADGLSYQFHVPIVGWN